MRLSPPLDRAFRLIAFDWDGTAVASRFEDARPVRGPIERLLRCDVLIVVVTGTNLRNLDGQLSRAIRGTHKRNLFLATNRGSEVYGFDDAFEPVLLASRKATPDEERVLTEIADAVRDALVARTGLDIRVIYDRLNRRKVDLIAVERWKDPPKSALGELIVAVESRLKAAGLDGLHEAIELMRQIAREKGLPDARITSDVKHLEIGLTDKADSALWIARELAQARGIPPDEILIGGDEFGPIMGFAGSDSRILVPELASAVVVSVGPEPGGVPPGVIHLGGGPARFRELLAAQAALHPVTLPGMPEGDPAWIMVEEGFVIAREHEIESLFAISNGFMGSRGSLAEGSPLSAPSTFVAGVFERPAHSVPELAHTPMWSLLSAKIDGSAFRIDLGEPLEHQRTLDLRQGILWRNWRHRDASGRITHIRGMRIASQADRHMLLQSVTLTPENYTGAITVETPARTRVCTVEGTVIELVAMGHLEAPTASYTTAPPPPVGEDAPERWTLELELGKTYRLDRIASVYTSRHGEHPDEAARASVQRAYERGLEIAIEEHRAAWRARWHDCDVEIDGDLEVQRAVRFAMYHLISAANPDDEHVSIGARALTGPAYKGHVFWDTEIYMLPFYTLVYPRAARALLMYRYHTLPAARARAAQLGYRGALYAWESADTGEDVTPPYVVAPTGEIMKMLVAQQEHHISADIAYAVWRYWQVTGDERFLRDAGAEVLVETARFWASRVRRAEDDRYHIRRVIGPDEYHIGVDDNAYTNGMARWNLQIAVEAASLVAERWPDAWRALAERLHFDPAEAREWSHIASHLCTGFDAQTGLFEQFTGYFELEDLDLRAYEPRTAPLDLILGPGRLLQTKVVKQPDVLMLLYLLGDQFPREVREANYRYYEPRTSHGSSLSPPIHAALAAQLGDVDAAMRYLHQTIEIDLANGMGNAAGGVHAAALGGLWQAIVFGFAGLAITPSGPRVEPHLPDGWRGTRFAIQWREQRVPVEIRREATTRTAVAEAHP